MNAHPEYDEFRDLVLSRKSEVLQILYVEAAKAWAEAHMGSAKAEGDIKVASAEMSYLETIIKVEKKRLEIESKTAQAVE